MKLKEWLPQQADTLGLPVDKLLEFDVVEDYVMHGKWKKCPIERSYIFSWCVVTDGTKSYYVAFNENPAIGWSFPIKLKT